MCRWMAYSGAPIPLDQLLLKPEHSLIDQSLESRMGATTTNGDGFGMGWYGAREEPALYKTILPAWNDANLADLAACISSPLFMAHVRATTGSPIQQSNCHPFRHGKWLFVHNGLIADFARVKRDLVLAIAPELFAELRGSTDSEAMFFLALTFGLDADPIGGIARMAGFVEQVGRAHGVVQPIQMSIGLSDGERLYGFRYSSEGASRSLFHSKSMTALYEINPEIRDRFSPDARAVVSEPLSRLSEEWEAIPEATVAIVHAGEVERRAFAPELPG